MPTQPYDVLIAGGGLAGLCLARHLTREAPDAPGVPCGEACPPGARGRLQGRRIERRDRRPLFSARARPRAAPSRAAAREVRPAVFLSGRREPARRRALRARALRLSAGAVVPARSRPPREHAAAQRPGRRRRRARRLPRDGVRVRRVAPSPRDPVGRPHGDRRRPMAGRRQRTERAHPAPARPDAASRPPRQRVLVPRAVRGSRSTTGPRTRPGRRACHPGSAG